MKIRDISIAKMIAALAAAIVPLFVRAASDELASGLDSLGWSSKFTITANPEEPLENFPMLIRIKENESPTGFFYKYAKPDGSDIRFIYRDKEGNVKLDENGFEPKILEHEIDTWDTSGESVIWVKVPKYENGASVTMYWGELADKEIPKAKDPKAVWSDYLGVWHMDDAENAKNGGIGTLGSDSNTNQVGKIGEAYGKTKLANSAILKADSATKTLLNSLNSGYYSKTFTVSCWIKPSGKSDKNAMIFSRKSYNDNGEAWGVSFPNGNNNNKTERWSTIKIWLKDDDTHYLIPKTGIVEGEWNKIDIVLADDFDDDEDGKADDKVLILINGKRMGYELWAKGIKYGSDSGIGEVLSNFSKSTYDFQIGAVDKDKNTPGGSYRFYGSVDEMRIREGATSEARLLAEYDQVQNKCYEFNTAAAVSGVTFKNRWLEEPSINKTIWGKDETAATVTNGVALYGTPYYTFTSTTPITNEVPTEAGIYTFVYKVDEKDPIDGQDPPYGWEPLAIPEEIVNILEKKPEVMDLGGTLSGRVLIANDWSSDGKDDITGQKYDCIDPESDSYWVHSNEEDQNLPYLSDTTKSELKSKEPKEELCGLTTLWRLENVRIGNLYEESGSPVKTMNYLSQPGKAIDAAHLVMCNSEDSVIYSPIYTDGIGTIYFDAVNALINSTTAKLVVEICTNKTDWAQIKETDWVQVKLNALKKDGAKVTEFDAPKEVDVLSLDVKAGGDTNNFFRVFVKVNYYGPISFRIKRVEVEDAEENDYILVDNIIASYPAIKAEFDTYGTLDPKNRGKATVGVAGAFNEKLPSVYDTITGRGKVKYFGFGKYKDEDVKQYISSALIAYRCRYLNEPVNDWRNINLDPEKGFTADSPFDIPKGLPGDIEYYYLTLMNAPYYEYVDYSGLNLKVGGYSEYKSTTMYRLNSPTILESQGTDWFIRLREGRSDYENIKVEIKETIGSKTLSTNVTMELVEDGIWRCVYPTLEEKTIQYRLEAFNKQSKDIDDWSYNTNRFKIAENESNKKLPVNDMVIKATSTDWATVECDAATGYVLFQFDEVRNSLTIVHADYQNFNNWNDAFNTNKVEFVGHSVSNEDGGKSGTSSKSRQWTQDFSQWLDMVSTNRYWQEKFSYPQLQQFEDYIPFREKPSPNGFTLINGKIICWNYRNYEKDVTDRGFQMKGNGEGAVELSSPIEKPRGIDTIRFDARVAQNVDFDEVAYYDPGVRIMNSMSNYTFVVAGSFDGQENKGFRGNASLSIFAYYHPKKGAYEVRVEQALSDTSYGDVDSASRNGQRLALYRWNIDSISGILSETLLAEVLNNSINDKNPNDPKNDVIWPLSDGKDRFQPIYFSVSNALDGVQLNAGFLNDASFIVKDENPLNPGHYEINNKGVGVNWGIAEIEGKRFKNISYRDKNEQKLTSGTYGLLTANSEGLFVNARYVSNPVNITTDLVYFSGDGEVRACYEEIKEGEWLHNTRMVCDPALLGYRAEAPKNQTVEIYTSPSGRRDWKLLATTNITTFGVAYDEFPYLVQINVKTNENLSVKISTGIAKTDIAIDNIDISQFSGGDWEDAKGYANDWVADNNNASGYNKFVFTKAWIKNGSVKLSARRTKPGEPSSIRSPLFDGETDSSGQIHRGIGLGKFSAEYKNAHSNVIVHLQIATNISYQTMGDIDTDNAKWSTIRTWNFNTDITEEKRKSGVLTHYLGMHGVKGIMRLVMDDNLVKDCNTNNIMNEADFPEIEIVKVIARDEPDLDERSWWGWNIRTVGDAGSTSKELQDDLNRMYLYDRTIDPEQVGLSLALNNAVKGDAAQIVKGQEEEYKQFRPFVQSPIFGRNLPGEITFKARKYNAYDPSGHITLFGSKTGDNDAESWVELKEFTVSNSTYTTYTHKIDTEYMAFRLAVKGVDGVVEEEDNGSSKRPFRVLIDEVLISEAMFPIYAFRNVGAFRSNLDTTDCVQNVPSPEEQPLVGESWGVQCEIYPAQLKEQIDYSKDCTVTLHWFAGEEPWGFDNWRTNAAAKSAKLEKATNTNNIYRSSYKLNQKSVIDAIQKNATVQYELEVVFHALGVDAPRTNYLSKTGTWINPPWYKNVNKNNLKDRIFTAYTLLDNIAPGWAWINEVNIRGVLEGGDNMDKTNQFFEIAAPANQSLAEWKIRIIEQYDSTTYRTNEVAEFGINDLQPLKRNNKNMDRNNMVYHVIGGPKSRDAGTLKIEDGSLDGVWNFEQGLGMQMLPTSQILGFSEPIGVQLVRKNGIVEHEIGFTGYCTFKPGDVLYDKYNASNFVNNVNRITGSQFIYAGQDDYEDHYEGDPAEMGKYSLSVTTGRGTSTVNWVNNVVPTPGKRNQGQVIDGEPPTPNGSSILIYANLDTSVPHIRQTLGEFDESSESKILVVPKGLKDGTNIIYKVDKWYELDSVITNNVAVSLPLESKEADGTSTYKITVAKNASNNVTVVAKAMVNNKLVNDYGLGPDNKYSDAIIDWLEKGESLKFGEWENSESEEIIPARFETLSGNFVTNLTLTQMYWLDIDPTAGNFVFRGGMVEAPRSKIKLTRIGGAPGGDPDDYLESEDYAVGVKLYITNTTENSASKYYNQVWAPYVLRGRGKGETSLNYGSASEPWSNVTFRVKGYLNNHLTLISDKKAWIPLRWFVFDYDEINKKSRSFNDDFTARIEIRDPFGTDSPGYIAGWYKWHKEHPEDGLFFSWGIDAQEWYNYSVEVLKPEN